MSLYDQIPENSFLKKLLFGEDPAFVERFLTVKTKFDTETEKEQKTMARDQFVGLFWDLYGRIAVQVGPSLSSAKRLFLRFGIVDMRYLSAEDQKNILAISLSPPDYSSETIFYADEWLQGVREGRIKPSATDETDTKNAKPAIPMHSPLNPKREKFESLISIEKDRYRRFLESKDAAISRLMSVTSQLEFGTDDPKLEITGLLSANQMKLVDELSEIQKELRRQHKDMAASAKTIEKAMAQLAEIDGGSASVSTFSGMGLDMNEILQQEVGSLRQMHKMTVGRQGNMFPILNSGLIAKEAKSPLFKEYMKSRVEHWLDLDPEAFNRTYRGETLTIPPHVVLLPGYGTIGVCWDPLDKDNRQFGKGRCAVGIFSRIPDVSLLSFIADIRWQAAKEIASYYWMEEGLTGRYYEYYLSAKLKGDLRQLFITDYLLWMTKETQGVQKLEKDARYVFWRYVPLPDDKKIRLSKKGYYYSQLWENEQIWRKAQENR